MAGYHFYSLDWSKFTNLVSAPTDTQLTILTKGLAAELREMEDEFDEDDAMCDWPTSAKLLSPIVASRLAMEDWYGDLSDIGREVWERNFYGKCMGSKKLDIGYRVDGDSIYWDVMMLVVKKLGDKPEKPGKSFMSRFGTVPFRYHPSKKSSDWHPMHSMHPPEDVAKMADELRSLRPMVEKEKDAEIRKQFFDYLLPIVEKVASDERLLFIQVDT